MTPLLQYSHEEVLAADPGKEPVRLLGQVSLSVPSGAILLLEGPSGSGKSTLLRAISGLARVEGARRILSGREYQDNDLPLWRSMVTLVAQDAPMLKATLLENLAFPFGLKNARGRSFDMDRAKRLLEEAGLGDLGLHMPASSLSGGQRHRLALVRAILWDPAVILADEPVSGLETRWRRRCLAMLEAFARRKGHGALCVLHDPEPNCSFDQVLEMRDGRLY